MGAVCCSDAKRGGNSHSGIHHLEKTGLKSVAAATGGGAALRNAVELWLFVRILEVDPRSFHAVVKCQCR